MQRGERVRDAVLHQVIAGRHLAAEAIAAVGDGHFAGGIGRGLNQHGYIQTRAAQGIGNGAFVAEVGQSDDNAIDAYRDAGGRGPRISSLLRSFPQRHSWSLAVLRETTSTPAVPKTRNMSSRPSAAR